MLNQLKPVEGARHTRKRKGQGVGSGLGKTAGRGQKGQNSRSGGSSRIRRRTNPSIPTFTKAWI